jgi:hypothetical protein
MNQQQRDLYEATLESLTNHPEQWTSDGRYQVEHPSGVNVWIANDHYGMHIGVRGRVVVGGVTGASSFFGPVIPWRRKLRAAALAIPAPPRPDVVGDAIVALGEAA